MKKVYKYGTGHEIPEGAEYLTTVVENEGIDGNYGGLTPNPSSFARLVWHYFLVEVGK